MMTVGPELRLVQELAGERLLGRVFGLRDLAGNIAFVIAFLGAGALLSVVGSRAIFAVGGVALLVLAPVGALLFHPPPSTSTDRAGTPEDVPDPQQPSTGRGGLGAEVDLARRG